MVFNLFINPIDSILKYTLGDDPHVLYSKDIFNLGHGVTASPIVTQYDQDVHRAVRVVLK
jgi:hypothetical protein